MDYRQTDLPERYDYGRAGNPAGAAPPPPRGPFSLELRDRLATLHDVVGTTCSQLAALRERQLGPWPESVSPSGAGQPGKLAAVDEALASLDALLDTARRAKHHADVLSDGL